MSLKHLIAQMQLRHIVINESVGSKTVGGAHISVAAGAVPGHDRRV